MCSQHASSTRIFWGHGAADPLVTFDIGRASVDFLKTDLGLSAVTAEGSDASALTGILFKSYAGLQHGAAPEELNDLKKWLKVILPKFSG
jgi:predicted esterase